jgi:hypothetical protein
MWKRGNYSIGALAKDAYGDVYAATKNHNSTTPPSGSNTNWKYVKSTSFVSNDTLAARVTKLESKSVVTTPPATTVDTLKFPAANVTPPAGTTFPTFTYSNLSGQTAPGDNNFTPSISGTAAAGTPVISEWVRTGATNDVIVLTGANFTSGTTFIVYSKTTTANATVKSIDVTNQMATIALPSTIGTWSTFLICAQNATGKGEPVLINNSEIYWIETKAKAGDVGRIYGRNLSTSFGTSTAYVYLKNTSGGAITQATVTSVNPHHIKYTVPAVANGTYEVWTHNGHGTNYGWSKSPKNLEVWSGITWSGATVNVSVTANSEAAASANTTAINNAINSNGGAYKTIVVNASGDVWVNAELKSNNQIRLKGLGKTTTRLVTTASWSGNYLFEAGNPTNFQIEDIGIKTNNTFAGGRMFNLENNEYFILKNVRIDAKTNSFSYFNNRSRIYISGCDLWGRSLDLNHNTQVFIDNSSFKQAGDIGYSITTWACEEVAVENCTWEDYGTASDEQGTGRFWSGQGAWRGQGNYYFAGNVGDRVGPRDAIDQNQGEAFMSEGAETEFSASPTSTTTTTATFSSSLFPMNDEEIWYAHILKGKGAGQVRRLNVPATNYTTKTITLATGLSWKVQPDATSVIGLAGMCTNVTIYNNSSTGKVGKSTQVGHVALTMSEPFGNCFNWTTDQNTDEDYRVSWYNYGTHHNENATDPNMWCLFMRNTSISARSGAVHWGKKADLLSFLSGPLVFVSVFRNNTVITPLLESATYQLPATAYPVPSLMGIVWDKNTGITTPVLRDDGDGTYSTPAAGTITNETYHIGVLP